MAIYNGNQKVNPSGIASAYIGTQKVYESTPHVEEPSLCFTAYEDTSIALNINGTLTVKPTLQYKLNNGSSNDIWTNYTFGTVISMTSGNKCYFKGDNSSFSTSSSNYISFTSTGNVKVSGNIMSLLDSTCSSQTIPSQYCFSRLFYNCATLINAKDLLLSATTLKAYCYRYMFMGCTSLLTPPALPATTLANSCYASMFSGCSSLIYVPTLPATNISTNGTYSYMFSGCTSLKVYNSSGEGHTYEWSIPSDGVLSVARTQSQMFYGTQGNYTSTISVIISKLTLYTQNPPIE